MTYIVINDQHYYAQGYSVDGVILIYGRRLNIISELINAIRILEKWYVKLLTVSAEIAYWSLMAFSAGQSMAVPPKSINFYQYSTSIYSLVSYDNLTRNLRLWA